MSSRRRVRQSLRFCRAWRAARVASPSLLFAASRPLYSMKGRSAPGSPDWLSDRVALRPSRRGCRAWPKRSEEHTSELQSLMRISYAVFCLKKKKTNKHVQQRTREHDTYIILHTTS